MTETADQALLTVTNLSAGYGPIRVLHSIDLSVKRGSITALIGANGAGKTTIMRALAGLIEPSAGTLTFDGIECQRHPSHLRVAQGMALVPEGRMVFSRMTVEQNLILGAINPSAREQHEARLLDVYRRFPKLKERRNQLAGLMSGGEQQMLALGRGLMSAPKLILLDEPTLGLAPIMVNRIFETIEELREGGFSILLAEQSARRALEVADEAFVLENGSITKSAPASDLLNSPEVRRAYLGG